MPMRILLVTSSLKPTSGWGTFSRITAEGLRAQGHDVFVLCHRRVDGVPEQTAGLADPLRMTVVPWAWIRSALAIVRAARRCSPDVIHVLVEPYALAMPIARAFGMRVPWVMNLHGTYVSLPLARRRTRFLMDGAYRQAGGFLSCSRYTFRRAEQALERFGSDEALRALREKNRFFRFGVPPPASMPSRVPSAVPHALYVGGVKERKGILELIRGCDAYARDGAPLQLTIVGDHDVRRPYDRAVLDAIASSSLRGHATCTGNVSAQELERLYASADVFLMLSKDDGEAFEGYGLVFVEAGHRGIPVIGSRDSGCREAIDEGVSGYSVDASDPEDIAAKLRLILQEKTIRSEACVTWAKGHSVAGQLRAFAEVYAAALSGVRPSGPPR